jgi:signal transduction histidine kinase/CheY-like chemotaxis protein
MRTGTTRWRTRTRVLVALVTIGIGVVEGYIARRQFDAQEAESLRAWRTRLGQIAGDRATLVGTWAGDIASDLRAMAGVQCVREALAQGEPANGSRSAPVVPTDAWALVRAFVAQHPYRSAMLVDPDGRTVLSAGARTPPSMVVPPGTDSGAAEGDVTISLMYVDPSPLVVARIVVPVGSRQALVVITADPFEWLFPQIDGGSLGTKTGELMLIERREGRPVLLSPARDPTRPLSSHGFPTAFAGSGLAENPPDGVAWTDYRGHPVIGAVREISGTPWSIVAKVDRDEAVTTYWRGAWDVLVRTGGFMAVLLAIVFALLRHRHAIYVSQQLKSTDQIGFLNRLLLTISEVNELMVREKDRQQLLDETCRIIVQHGGFRMAWLGELEVPNVVRPVASAGAAEDYLKGLDIRLGDAAMGRGPTGRAIAERRTVVADDIATDWRMTPWRERALTRGYRSSVAIPLFVGERVLGALNVYSSNSGVFRGEALALLERLANDLSFVIDVMERQARHRETEQVLVVREEQLRQAQKMEAIGRLAGGVAHDFNNLLMAISGYAELALSAKTEDSRRERIEEIATAAERAAALTRQLLAFSRKQVLQPRVFNLNIVVAEIEKMLRRLIGENIELVTRLAPSLDNVRADPGQLEQVIVNLVVNARDAMPDGGRLEIETANVLAVPGQQLAGGELEPGHYVVLRVRDNGQGMTPDVIEHLFEPFFTTKDSGKGTGLGLSMVYGIVKQSGGAVSVDSAPEAGSSFSVYLPVAAVREEPDETSAEPAEPRPGGGRLLVVEDNPAVRHFVTEALTTAGYEVVDAESAEQALEVLRGEAGRFDLLLTDVILPRMDGYDLARLAAAARPGLVVIYMSGYVDSPRLRELALTEGIDLVEKPFTSAVISARVAAALDRTPQRSR